MGGFATNGVNMTKLESYQLEGQFSATQFYADIEGHPSDRRVRLALEELEFFTSYLRVLGVYRASPYRAEIARRMARTSGELKRLEDEMMGDRHAGRKFESVRMRSSRISSSSSRSNQRAVSSSTGSTVISSLSGLADQPDHQA